MCQKKYKNVVELCTYCKKQLSSANGPNGSIIERGLIEVFKQRGAEKKARLYRKLVTKISPGTSNLEANNERLKKENKALYDRLRKKPARKPTKTTLGFKQKAKIHALKKGMILESSQMTVIKRSALKSNQT